MRCAPHWRPPCAGCSSSRCRPLWAGAAAYPVGGAAISAWRVFTAESTRNVAWALLWYAAGLVGHCALEIVARAFYALQDTRTPVVVGVGAMTLNLVLSIAFSALFTAIGWMPHGGLALANSMATALETILLLALISRRLNGLEGRRTLLSSLKFFWQPAPPWPAGWCGGWLFRQSCAPGR